MSDDLEARIVGAAPTPPRDVDLAAVHARARQLRRRRAIAMGTGSAVVISLVATAALALLGRPGDLVIGQDPATPATASESREVVILDPVDDVIARTGLVAFDAYDLTGVPPPPLQDVLDLPVCGDASGLIGWATAAVAPFGELDGGFQPTSLAEVADTTPIRRVEADRLSCTLAGTIGDVEVWELRATDGTVVGRGLGSEALAGPADGTFSARQDKFGGINFGQTATASGQHVHGVWRGDVMELRFSELQPRRESLLIIEWPSAPLPPDIDMDLMAQRIADARAGELTTAILDAPDYYWPSPLPRAVPAGFVRCAGPYANTGFQAYDTELCDEDGHVIRVSTTNKGGNPVPNPPTSHIIEETESQLVLNITTPVEDVTITVPSTLGRATLEAMAETIPLLDPRVWAPTFGRDRDLADAYSRQWWADQLAAANSSDVVITEAPIACSGEGGRDRGGCTFEGQPPFEGTFTTAAGDRLAFFVFGAVPDTEASGQPTNGPWPASYAVTVGDTDVFITQGYNSAVRSQCGGVMFSLQPADQGEAPPATKDDAILNTMAAILTNLRC